MRKKKKTFSSLRLAHELYEQLHVLERLRSIQKSMQVYFRTEFAILNYISFDTNFKFITVTLLVHIVPVAFPKI